jgi:hypothetical protein
MEIAKMNYYFTGILIVLMVSISIICRNQHMQEMNILMNMV